MTKLSAAIPALSKSPARNPVLSAVAAKLTEPPI